MHEQPALEGGRPQGQMERALVRLAIGGQLQRQARHDALAVVRQGEYDQQVRVNFNGKATDIIGYSDIAVGWEHPFVYAPLQRDPDFETPHVSHHIEFQQPLDTLIIAHAHVVQWTQSDEGWYIGAKVRVAVQAPGAPGVVGYAATLHMTFEGFACPTDQEDY